MLTIVTNYVIIYKIRKEISLMDYKSNMNFLFIDDGKNNRKQIIIKLILYVAVFNMLLFTRLRQFLVGNAGQTTFVS